MYFGRRHSARVTLRQTLTFTCRYCAYTSDAEVVATGRGEGNSPFLLDEEGAQDRAMSAAEERARNTLVDTVGFAHCPKCHRRNDTAVRYARLKAGFLGALLGAVVLVTVWVFDGAKVFPAGLKFSAPAAALAILAVYWSSRGRWAHADARVTFPPVRARPSPSKKAAPAPAQPPVETAPYRSAPVAAIAVVETAKPLAPAPVVPGDPDNKPTFLT